MRHMVFNICFLLAGFIFLPITAESEAADKVKIYRKVDPAAVSAIDKLTEQSGADNAAAEYNLPDPKKIYEDESGSYYGIIVSNNGAFPSQVSEQDVRLYIAAIRKPDKQGRIIDVVPKTVKDRRGNAVDGYAFGKSETERVNKHILPRVTQLFDKKWYPHHLYFINFLEGYHFGYSRGPFYIEERVFSTSYSFDSSGALIPSYEKRGLSGVPKDYIIPTVKEALSTLKQNTEKKEGNGNRIKAIFDYHEQDYSKRKEKQLRELHDRMKAERKKGTVYLSGEYWDDYKYLDTARNIFDGNFHFIENPGDLAYTYLSYVDSYYNVCESSLPVQRASYDAKYFSTQYGITTLDREYYVEMERRFAKKYEEILYISKRADYKEGIEAFIKTFSSGKNAIDLSRDMLTMVVEKAYVDAEMRKFLKGSCGSARVKQFGDNLYAAANNLKPVQKSGKRYLNAENESEAITRDDAERYLDLSLRYMARHPSDESKGFPYAKEELSSYRRGLYAEDGMKSGKDEKKYAKLRSIGSSIAREKHPVLTCYYGPLGFYPGGGFKYYNYSFWYVEEPSQLEEFLAARTDEKDVYPGLLNVVSECPRDSNTAHRMVWGEKIEKVPEEKAVKAAPVKPASPKRAQIFTGSWKAEIDNQPIEVVLWPNRQKTSFVGYVYAPKHDCLMYANVKKYEGQLLLNFGEHNANDRVNNCKLNTDSLDEKYKTTFQGGAFITINEGMDVINFKTTSLYLGKRVATSSSELNVDFVREPVSEKLLNILKTYNNRILGMADEEFLIEITK